MNSSTEKDGFFNAAQARQIALGQSSNNSDILMEINTLQQRISTEAVSNELNISITDGTVMTDSLSFFNSWNDPYNNDTSEDKLNRAKMNFVINYFSRLGYLIGRTRRNTLERFQWDISW